MLETNLKQPDFRYSAWEIFAKIKKKIKEKGDYQIYKTYKSKQPRERVLSAL